MWTHDQDLGRFCKFLKRLNFRGTGFCSRLTRQFDARSLASNLTLDNDASNPQNTLPAMEAELEETEFFNKTH